jgi:hypothetical protein
MWQAIVVGLIVVVAGAYTAWALLPATLRLRLAQGIGAWGRQPGRAVWLGRASAAVERAARSRLGGCSDCSAVQANPKSPSRRQPPPE